MHPLERLVSLAGARGALAVACLLLAACGGGGGGGGAPPPGPTAPTGLAYSSPATFAVGTAIAPLVPTVNGTVTAYEVTPALPAGLVLDAATGRISGTPTAILDQVAGVFGRVAKEASVRTRLGDLAMRIVDDQSPAYAKSWLDAERTKWETIIQEAGIRAD